MVDPFNRRYSRWAKHPLLYCVWKIPLLGVVTTTTPISRLDIKFFRSDYFGDDNCSSFRPSRLPLRHSHSIIIYSSLFRSFRPFIHVVCKKLIDHGNYFPQLFFSHICENSMKKGGGCITSFSLLLCSEKNNNDQR